jgi:hypothetical protein
VYSKFHFLPPRKVLGDADFMPNGSYLMHIMLNLSNLGRWKKKIFLATLEMIYPALSLVFG